MRWLFPQKALTRVYKAAWEGGFRGEPHNQQDRKQVKSESNSTLRSWPLEPDALVSSSSSATGCTTLSKLSKLSVPHFLICEYNLTEHMVKLVST